MSVSALHNEASKKGAIILCGGKSSRMGRDKATLPFGPELMLQRIVRLLSEEVDSSAIAVVSAKGQILPPLPPEIRVVCDENPGRGPLEGLAAGLKAMPDHVDAVYATSFDEVDTMEVDVESLRVFDPMLSTLMNLNHPEDYEKALKQLENRT